MARVRRRTTPVAPLDVRNALAELPCAVAPGARIAIAVGSRGITDLVPVVRRVVELIRRAGGIPFVVPAMGSHGGATPEGQAAVLSDFGVTPAALGLALEPSLEVERIGQAAEGFDVYFSAAALEADGVVLINRVKPHTDFRGAIGSGLLKMMVIGLGKPQGAAVCHAAAARLGLELVIRSAAAVVLAAAPIMFGVAILENAAHATHRVEIVLPDSMLVREPQLHEEAQRLMPQLPFDDVDLLIVDRMGKNISGAGMDPNVIGREVHGYSSSLATPQGVRRIFVRELTGESHGNAIGVGLADFTTLRLVQRIDPRATFTNALTALTIQMAKVPIYFQTDREAIERALGSLAIQDFREAKVVRIRDTLDLSVSEVSQAYERELAGHGDLSQIEDFSDMRFDGEANLLPWEQ